MSPHDDRSALVQLGVCSNLINDVLWMLSNLVPERRAEVQEHTDALRKVIDDAHRWARSRPS